MLAKLKSSFAWQVTSGFVLGTIATIALQPAEATDTLVHRFARQAQPGR